MTAKQIERKVEQTKRELKTISKDNLLKLKADKRCTTLLSNLITDEITIRNLSHTFTIMSAANDLIDQLKGEKV